MLKQGVERTEEDQGLHPGLSNSVSVGGAEELVKEGAKEQQVRWKVTCDSSMSWKSGEENE